MKNMEFEWDDEKERINIQKHGLDFSTAAHVFSDDCRIEKYDHSHSDDEDRYIVIGSINGYLTIVTVSYTPRSNGTVIRIISARVSTKEEKEE